MSTANLLFNSIDLDNKNITRPQVNLVWLRKTGKQVQEVGLEIILTIVFNKQDTLEREKFFLYL